MGMRIPSVRDATRPSNGSVGQRDVVRPPSSILLLPRTPFPFSLYIEQSRRPRGDRGSPSVEMGGRPSRRSAIGHDNEHRIFNAAREGEETTVSRKHSADDAVAASRTRRGFKPLFACFTLDYCFNDDLRSSHARPGTRRSVLLASRSPSGTDCPPPPPPKSGRSRNPSRPRRQGSHPGARRHILGDAR